MSIDQSPPVPTVTSPAPTRRRRFSLPLIATTILASLTLSASTANAATCTAANVLPALASVPTAKAATLCLINGERSAAGLSPLASEPTLESVATAYSQEMVRTRFFGHVSPTGQTFTDRLAPYANSASTSTLGENLAWGEGALATPASVVRNWMASPGHRENILGAGFTEIGVGIAGGSPVGSLPAVAATYTTEFGSRSSAPPATRATASSLEPQPVGAPQAKPVSARQKQQISKRCHRIAKRTKASKKTRAKRYDRCVSTALRAAAR
jgi:uncharacterized protein YkwD